MKLHVGDYHWTGDEEYWVQLVEHDLEQGWPTIKVPLTSFSRSVALALAKKLDADVKSEGRNYVFRRDASKHSTIVH